MEKEQMIEYLRNYNTYGYQVHKLEKEIDNLRDQIFDYNIKLTANMGINNDIHSKNQIGDKVYNAVIEIEKKRENNQARIVELEAELKQVKEKMDEVDAFLNALYDFERVAIVNFFVKHRTKFDIGEHIFLSEFGVPKSEKTITNIINRAFDKL